MNGLPIRFVPEAEAAAHYEAVRAGLGARSTSRVRNALQQAAQLPLAGGIVRGEIRQVVVRDFPYVVVYQPDPTEIVVIAVFHTSRDPAVWQAPIES